VSHIQNSFNEKVFTLKRQYYCLDGKELHESERATQLLPRTGKLVNEGVLYDFLMWGLLDHTEETFFEDISQVPLGCRLVKGEKPHIERVWAPPQPDLKEELDVSKRFLDLLHQAVSKNVPNNRYAILVSGGIDSSCLAVMANEVNKPEIFSSVYNSGTVRDERNYLEMICRILDVEPHLVKPAPLKLVKDLDDLLETYETPFGSTSLYAEYCVHREIAQQGLPIAFNGQGPDELLAGYMPYLSSYYYELLKGKQILTLLKELTLGFPSLGYAARRYFRFVASRRGNVTARMLNQEFVKKQFGRERKTHTKGLSARLTEDITQYNFPQILRLGTRNAERFGIELRLPYLDEDFVNFACRLPLNWRIRNGWTKYILRKVMEDKVPSEILKRRDKIGFETPEAMWMRTSLKEEMLSVFNSKRFKERPYFDQEDVIKNFKRFCEGKMDDNYSRIFWRFYVTELWLRKFLD